MLYLPYPQKRLESPTPRPTLNRLYPENIIFGVMSVEVPEIFPIIIIAIITPYIATASQKMTETRFFDLILGVLTAAPSKLLPVKKIPLC